jgi:metal-responsive CopG/Arc/MetJ family transcriptional regulator
VAKVMVSLPDDLLSELDAEARRRGTTRSGLLRDLAAHSLHDRTARRAARISDVLEKSTSHGGEVVELLKRHRPR